MRLMHRPSCSAAGKPIASLAFNHTGEVLVVAAGHKVRSRVGAPVHGAPMCGCPSAAAFVAGAAVAAACCPVDQLVS